MVHFLLAAAVLTSGKKDILRSDLDTTVSPGADFAAYANGGWLKRNPIPSTESFWGIGNLVRDELYVHLRKISEDSAKQKAIQGSDAQKVGDFWATAMDEAKADRLGLQPLRAELNRINTIATVENVLVEAFDLQKMGVGVLFSASVQQDEKNSSVMEMHLGQGGLGLPDRDYYFNNEAGVAKARQEYVSYMANLLSLAGERDTTTAATNVMAFETALANVSRKIEDLRDPEHNYNKMPIGDVQAKLSPSIDWASHIGWWGIHPQNVIVGQPEFFTGLDKTLAETPAETLRNYMKVQLINSYAAYLGKEARNLDFHFNRQVLNGQKQPQPLWKRSLQSENGALGFVLGRIFVKDYFPVSAKKRYSNLIEAVRTAYHKRIDKLDWMSPATKKKAHEKLAAVIKKVGFPDKWKDYSRLEISRDSLAKNMMSAARWNFEDNISKFGKPVDRTEWAFPPQTFNAYYYAPNNEIVMPAAAFAVPGYRDSELDEALVYGNAAGSWIGHEITHGFDDEGRQYDAKGNLKDWWTKEDGKRFQERADKLAKQFDKYEPIPGIHINGKSNLGENLADLGGIMLGLDAFKQTETYKRGKKIGGLTPIQRYFLGYSLSWLGQESQATLRRQLLSDVHSPAKYRINGPLSNVPDFYAAFGIKAGDKMWRKPEDRVRIW